MTDHQQIAETLQFVERHGYALLLFWVLADQGAIPPPSAPLMLAKGALIHAAASVWNPLS